MIQTTVYTAHTRLDGTSLTEGQGKHEQQAKPKRPYKRSKAGIQLWLIPPLWLSELQLQQR